jgi:hypothetical protein
MERSLNLLQNFGGRRPSLIRRRFRKRRLQRPEKASGNDYLHDDEVNQETHKTSASSHAQNWPNKRPQIAHSSE